MDGVNAEAGRYTKDAIPAVADVKAFRGEEKIAGFTRQKTHLSYVDGGNAHMSTLSYVVVKGEEVTTTCHAVFLRHAKKN